MVCKRNCGCGFEEVQATVPRALALATNASIRGFYQLTVCCGRQAKTILAFGARLPPGYNNASHLPASSFLTFLCAIVRATIRLFSKAMSTLRIGDTLPGSKWDFRLKKALGEGTHSSMVFLADIIAEGDGDVPAKWLTGPH